MHHLNVVLLCVYVCGKNIFKDHASFLVCIVCERIWKTHQDRIRLVELS